MQDVKQYMRTRRKKLNKENRCTSCGRQRDRPPCKTCLHCQKLSSARQEKIRQRVLDYYGGRCACCGYSDTRFLSIDHIIPLHRGERTSQTTGYGLWCKLQREGFPYGFQVLCYNCNYAKRGRPLCPHQEEEKPGRVKG